jgi:hypothetical protein
MKGAGAATAAAGAAAAAKAVVDRRARGKALQGGENE